METAIDVQDVEIKTACGILVCFNDGTAATYPAEELAALRPVRLSIEEERSRMPDAPHPHVNFEY